MFSDFINFVNASNIPGNKESSDNMKEIRDHCKAIGYLDLLPELLFNIAEFFVTYEGDKYQYANCEIWIKENLEVLKEVKNKEFEIKSLALLGYTYKERSMQ